MFIKLRAWLISVAAFLGFYKLIFPTVWVITKSSISGEPRWKVWLWPGITIYSGENVNHGTKRKQIWR